MSSRKYLLVLLIVVAVILHGSLYPYAFHNPPAGPGPIRTLLDSWADPPSSYGDLIANLLLYMPFGFFGALALSGGGVKPIAIISMAGLCLCTGIELAQYYDAGRVTNMSDVYLNTLGSALGGSGAVLVGARARRLRGLRASVDPVPLLLLAAMLGYHLFPYVPTIDLHKYWRALQPLLLSPRILPDDFLRYTALWLTSSCLLESIAGFGWSCVLVPLFMAGVFAARVMIDGLVVTPSETGGAALALALWLLLGRYHRFAAIATAALLCAAIVLARLQPFDFQSLPRPFGWLPFRSFLAGSLYVNTISLLEKAFYYGSLVWLIAEAGLPLLLSALLVGTILFATSIAETYLPGRSAEITDALIVLIMAVLIAAMRRPRATR